MDIYGSFSPFFVSHLPQQENPSLFLALTAAAAGKYKLIFFAQGTWHNVNNVVLKLNKCQVGS